MDEQKAVTLASDLRKNGLHATPYDSGGGLLVVALYASEKSMNDSPYSYIAMIGDEDGHLGMDLFNGEEHVKSVDLDTALNLHDQIVHHLNHANEPETKAMDYREAKLHAKIKAVNRANAEALRLAPILRAAIEPFVGQKVYVGSGELSAKIRKALEPLIPHYKTAPKGLEVYRYHSDYSLIYIVKICEHIPSECRSCLYHEVSIYIGDVKDGVLTATIKGFPDYAQNKVRTDYTVKEIQEKIEARDAAKKVLEAAESALYEFRDR